jgi:hypothetical protein
MTEPTTWEERKRWKGYHGGHDGWTVDRLIADVDRLETELAHEREVSDGLHLAIRMGAELQRQLTDALRDVRAVLEMFRALNGDKPEFAALDKRIYLVLRERDEAQR